MLEKPPIRLGVRILILCAYCAFILFWVLMGWPCMIRSISGIPCPGCGLSRAWLAALRLDFAAAFAYHPMFWSIPVIVLYVLFDGHLFPGKTLNFCILAGILAGFLVCYVLRLVTYLGIV